MYKITMFQVSELSNGLLTNITNPTLENLTHYVILLQKDKPLVRIYVAKELINLCLVKIKVNNKSKLMIPLYARAGSLGHKGSEFVVKLDFEISFDQKTRV